jgi:phospholipid/cholesterol/gamma-HCH transport system substrate-binding protein
MDKSNRNIKLGIFVILFSLIFTFVVYQASGGRSLINRSITIYAEFDNVKGLLIGNNVRFSGVKVGTVTDIKVKTEKVLLVAMSVEKNVTTYMKSNAKADISTNGLVGNMLVNITPGNGVAPLIKDGDTIAKKEKVELTDMLETLSTTNEKITQITEALLEITGKINNGSGLISQFINDENLAKNIKATTQNLYITSRNIKSSTDSVNNMIIDAMKGNGNLGYLLQDNSLKTKINELSNNLDSLINDRAEPIMRNLELSSEAIANTSIELESTIKDLQNKQGLVGAILQDTILAQNLKNTINNLNKGTQKFDESMEALQHNWLLKGFFKKKEKEAEKGKKNN